jgi:hypothetical protein
VSASTEPIRRDEDARWLCAGVLGGYLTVLVVGVGVGLFPEVVYHRVDVEPAAPLALLRAMLIGQLGFFLLIWPASLAGRPALCPLRAIAEAGALLLISAPVYVMSYFLSDASPADLVRALLTALAAIPPGLVASRYMLRWRASIPTVALALLLLTVGYPPAVYILREFVMTTRAIPEWVGLFGPFTFAWRQTEQYLDSPWPVPATILLAWIGLAFLGLMVLWIVGLRRCGPQAENN